MEKQISQLAYRRLNLRFSFTLINNLPLTEGHNRLDYLRFSTPDSADLKAYLVANTTIVKLIMLTKTGKESVAGPKLKIIKIKRCLTQGNFFRVGSLASLFDSWH